VAFLGDAGATTPSKCIYYLDISGWDFDNFIFYPWDIQNRTSNQALFPVIGGKSMPWRGTYQWYLYFLALSPLNEPSSPSAAQTKLGNYTGLTPQPVTIVFPNPPQ
jgi:hypothetical protein